jgi:hypothetical protein
MCALSICAKDVYISCAVQAVVTTHVSEICFSNASCIPLSLLLHDVCTTFARHSLLTGCKDVVLTACKEDV